MAILHHSVEGLPKLLERSRIAARSEGSGEMQDALKFLEELDKYYSQVARPRFDYYY